MSEEQRALLVPRAKEVVTHKTVVTHIPPKPWIGWRVLAVTWQAAVTAAVAWLVWQVK